MNPRNNICPDADFILRGHRFEITSLGFLSGTSHLVVGDVGGNLSLWSLESRRLVSRASLLHDHIISVKNFKNNQILTQGRDQKVKLMDLTSSTFEINSPLCTFQAGSYTFCEMDVDSENNWMILPAENPHSLQLWDLQQREPLCILKSEKEKFGICMACRLLSLGAQHFAFAGYEDGSVVLWCLKTRKILHRARYYDSPVMSLDVAANGIGFSGASGKKVVKFALNQNFDSFDSRGEVQLKTSGASSLCIRQDQKYFAVGGFDGKVRLFGFKKMKPLCVLSRHERAVTSIDIARANQNSSNRPWTMACGSRDKTISVWSVYADT